MEGRGFDRYVKTDSVGFLVNETAVRQMGFKDPIGKVISVFGKKGTIVGVLRDYHTNTLQQEIDPLVLDVKEHVEFGTILVRTEKGKTKKAVEGLEKLYSQVNPRHAWEGAEYPESFGCIH